MFTHGEHVLKGAATLLYHIALQNDHLKKNNFKSKSDKNIHHKFTTHHIFFQNFPEGK